MLSGINVISDYEEKNVVRGLATVGGLATVISGIFALLFGGSLLYQLLGKFITVINFTKYNHNHDLLSLADTIPFPVYDNQPIFYIV